MLSPPRPAGTRGAGGPRIPRAPAGGDRHPLTSAPRRRLLPPHRKPCAAADSPPALRAAPGHCWQPAPPGEEDEADIPVRLPKRALSGEKLAEMLFG